MKASVEKIEPASRPKTTEAKQPVVLRAQDARGVVILTLNRPQAFNALSETMLSELQREFDAIAGDEALGQIDRDSLVEPARWEVVRVVDRGGEDEVRQLVGNDDADPRVVDVAGADVRDEGSNLGECAAAERRLSPGSLRDRLDRRLGDASQRKVVAKDRQPLPLL